MLMVTKKILSDKMESQAESKRPSVRKPIFSEWQEMRHPRPVEDVFAPLECVFPRLTHFPYTLTNTQETFCSSPNIQYRQHFQVWYYT